jgi:hypothetical protein
VYHPADYVESQPACGPYGQQNEEQNQKQEIANHDSPCDGTWLQARFHTNGGHFSGHCLSMRERGEPGHAARCAEAYWQPAGANRSSVEPTSATVELARLQYQLGDFVFELLDGAGIQLTTPMK